MTVTEVLEGLGSWEIQLSPQTPRHITSALGFFGHVAIVAGKVDVTAAGDGLLSGARYVGVVRQLPKPDDAGQRLAGSGMVFWLGDEDDKGQVIESELNCSGMTLVQAVTAILSPVAAVTIGTIHAKAGTLPANTTFVYVSPRKALQAVCDAFGVEFRVNGDASVDVGTAAQLYNATADTIIVRKGTGSDPDLRGLSGTFDTDSTVYDWSDRILLVGRTLPVGDDPSELFLTAAGSIPDNPFLNLRGSPVRSTRIIDDSTVNEGTAASRLQLNINRFGRVVRSFRLASSDYDIKGGFVAGDQVLVYDPDTGIVDPQREVTFRGRVVHPESIRVTETSWNVRPGFTVAFRDQGGTWHDLTPFVTYEMDASDELVVGDLPRSLSRPGSTPLQDRLDAARGNTATDNGIPSAPTGLTLSTASGLNGTGQTISLIRAEWDPVELNTDGTTINDLDHYEVRYRWTDRSGWQTSITTDTDVDVQVVPDLPYVAQVSAVDITGNRSDWSAEVGITAASDAVAPPAPADPLVTSYLGQLRIEYVGTAADGQPMPSDTNRIDVHVGTTAGFTASADNRVFSLTPQAKGIAYATAPYGSVRYVRLIAVDHTGNPSASSAVVSGTTEKVAEGDVASVNIGSVTGGIGTFDVILSGSIFNAAFGKRAGINAVGFQAWDDDEQLTVSLDGADNLLTGLVRTGLPGTRRIEVGSAGAINELSFFAPDGTKGMVRVWTEPGGVEGMQLGFPVPNSSGLWNRINFNTEEWANYQARRHDFTMSSSGSTGLGGFFVLRESPDKSLGGPGNIVRIQVDGATQFWHGAGEFFGVNELYPGLASAVVRFRIGQYGQTTWRIDSPFSSTPGLVDLKPAATARNSPTLTFLNEEGYGGGFGYSNVSGENTVNAINWAADGYISVTASAFPVASDESLKDDIQDADDDFGALIDGSRVRSYRRRRTRGGPALPRREVGLVAQEAPPQIVGDGVFGKTVDHYQVTSILWGNARQQRAVLAGVLARLDTLEQAMRGRK